MDLESNDLLALQKTPDMTVHICHWAGCKKEVPPAMWGCKPHWFTLPKRLRDEVWAAYEPGQEITKLPSTRYVEVARKVQEWISGYKGRA